jgi:hypothetical protein
MDGNESKSKGTGSGLKDGTGFPGNCRRGDEFESCASPDIGVGVGKSLGRFEGRASMSTSGRIWSAAILVGRVDEI